METLNSSMVSKGVACSLFEAEHARLLNKQHGIACGSGTQGLVAILKHLNVGNSDEVILPSYVCDKVEEAVLAVKATPVLCDIGETWVMNYDTIKAKVSAKTKAIVLVHIFGINAYDKRMQEYGLPIIEDICQSTGSWNDQYGTGSYTDFAFTSFHATKCITTGQGGMVFCNSKEADESLRNSIKKDFLNDYSDLQASLGLAQLSEYPTILERRRDISQQYLAGLNPDLVRRTKNLNSMYFRFPVTWQGDFDNAKEVFESEEIAIRKGVGALIHRQNGRPDAEFPNTSKTFETTISLPILPQMSQEQVDHVISITNKVLA